MADRPGVAQLDAQDRAPSERNTSGRPSRPNGQGDRAAQRPNGAGGLLRTLGALP
jgi:hypothetical protein